MPELPSDQPHQSPKQSHAENILNRVEPQVEKIIAEEQEGAPQSRSSTYKSSVRNISSTGKTSTMSSCLHVGIWQLTSWVLRCLVNQKKNVWICKNRNHVRRFRRGSDTRAMWFMTPSMTCCCPCLTELGVNDICFAELTADNNETWLYGFSSFSDMCRVWDEETETWDPTACTVIGSVVRLTLSNTFYTALYFILLSFA